MKIVGVMRVCDEFVEEINLTVGALSAFCDEVCFLMDHVTHPDIIAAVDGCRNLAEKAEYANEVWNHYESCDMAYHLANNHDPDWVVMQDQDELLPFFQLHGGILEMQEYDADTLILPPAHCWGSPDRIVWPTMNQTGNHAKVYRGRNPDFTIAHGGGFCLPGCDYMPLYWPYPYRHLAFATESARERRSGINGARSRAEAWMGDAVPTIAYRPDWKIESYLEHCTDG